MMRRGRVFHMHEGTDDVSKVVLAFSGGLDTTYCAVWLREQGHEVHTVTANTGGFDGDELALIERRAAQARAASHTLIDARAELVDDYLRYLIFANALRGDVYPLCVSAERVVQARRTAQHAVAIGAAALAHGSTGAGNDQVRFDVAFRVVAPQLAVLTPIRDQGLSREQEVEYLKRHGIDIPLRTAKYSYNRGIWGATIGGGETHRSDGVLPEEAYVLTAPPELRPTTREVLEIEFAGGVPVAMRGQGAAPADGRSHGAEAGAGRAVERLERLNVIAGRHGVGRGMHVGDTILGIKGRVAFEAPAAVVLIAAHRELEKLVLSRQQAFWKRTLGELYGALLHEGRYFDPLMRDVEAFLASSQQRVSGVATVQLLGGQATVLGVSSPYSLMNSELARYGEGSALWSGAEAAAFCKIYGLQDALLAKAARAAGGAHAAVD